MKGFLGKKNGVGSGRAALAENRGPTSPGYTFPNFPNRVPRSIPDRTSSQDCAAGGMAHELKRLQRKTFMPVFRNPFSRRTREREKMAREVGLYDNRDGAEKALDDTRGGEGRRESDKASGSRYQFEPEGSDEEEEKELDRDPEALSDHPTELTETERENILVDKVMKQVQSPLSIFISSWPESKPDALTRRQTVQSRR